MCRERRHFQNIWERELRRAMLGILFQEVIEDVFGFWAVFVEEVLPFGLQSLCSFSSGPKRGVEGQVAEQIKRVGIRLAGLECKRLEINATLAQLLNDERALLWIAPARPEFHRAGADGTHLVAGVIRQLDHPQLFTIGGSRDQRRKVGSSPLPLRERVPRTRGG